MPQQTPQHADGCDFPRDAKLPSTSAAPIAPRCCLTEQNEGSVPQLLGDADLWRAMCPQLHVADAATAVSWLVWSMCVTWPYFEPFSVYIEAQEY
jgi:hypothetical protein